MHSTDGAFVSVYAVTCDTMWGVSERTQGECRRDLVNRNQWWDKHRAEDHEMVKFILYISRVLHVNKNHLLSSCKSRWCFILFFFFLFRQCVSLWKFFFRRLHWESANLAKIQFKSEMSIWNDCSHISAIPQTSWTSVASCCCIDICSHRQEPVYEIIYRSWPFAVSYNIVVESGPITCSLLAATHCEIFCRVPHFRLTIAINYNCSGEKKSKTQAVRCVKGAKS